MPPAHGRVVQPFGSLFSSVIDATNYATSSERRKLSSDHSEKIEADVALAGRLADEALDLLASALRHGPSHLVKEYFKITTNEQEDKDDIKRLLSNFGKIKEYFSRSIYYNRFWNPLTYWDSYRKSYPMFNLETTGKKGAIASTVPDDGYGKVQNLLGGNTITLYPKHYEMDDADRAATLVHEASHMLLSTEDHAYMRQRNRESGELEITEKWRKLEREKALTNADSYGQFALAAYMAEV